MKKIALVLCVMLNFVFAECKLYESADKMTDEKFHWTSCGDETFNINVFHMKKEIRPQKTNMYIREHRRISCRIHKRKLWPSNNKDKDR